VVYWVDASQKAIWNSHAGREGSMMLAWRLITHCGRRSSERGVIETRKSGANVERKWRRENWMGVR
jgi:hypothetical protein